MDRVKEFPVFPVIETERLVLREITMDDAEGYLEHFSRPEGVQGQGFPAYPFDCSQSASSAPLKFSEKTVPEPGV